MSFESLLKHGRIAPYHASKSDVHSLLEVAKRDLKTARYILSMDIDWSYSITYNAILQASRALMFSYGFRPRGGQEHLTVVQFLKEALGEEEDSKVALLDQMRRKRHRAIYERAGLVGKKEAEGALEFAEEFVADLGQQAEQKLSSSK